MLALQQLEDETCGCGCGQPVTECVTEVGPEYRIETVVCRAGAALEHARERGDQEPGTLMYVVPDVASTEDLDAEREAEVQALAALHANQRRGG